MNTVQVSHVFPMRCLNLCVMHEICPPNPFYPLPYVKIDPSTNRNQIPIFIHQSMQSVQWSWAAFAAAGLGGAGLGYLRYLKEDEERKVENERVQLLEQEKMRREAEALARLAEERKKARLLMLQQQARAEAGAGDSGKEPKKGSAVTLAAGVRPASSKTGPLQPRVVPMVKTTISIKHRLSQRIIESEMVHAMEEASAAQEAKKGTRQG